MKKIKEIIKKVCTKEIILYIVFGVLTTLVSLITYYICVGTFFNAENAVELQIANIIAWIVSVAFAYITNRRFVFESKNTNKLSEATKFVTSRLATLLMDMLIMFLGVTILKLNDRIIKLISQFIVIIANYVFSKIFVFKKK